MKKIKIVSFLIVGVVIGLLIFRIYARFSATTSSETTTESSTSNELLNDYFKMEKLSEGTVRITGVYEAAYTGDTFIIPSILNQKTVTEIGEFAFSDMLNDAQIKKVIIASTIQYIRSNAFSNNSTIEKVLFETNSQLTEIGEAAFSECYSLSEIELPDGVTTLKKSVFLNCKSLESFVIPKTLFSFVNNIFEGCTQFRAYTLNESHPKYTVEEGVLYNKEKTTVYHYPVGKTNSSYKLPTKTVNIYLDSFAGNTFLKEIDLNNARVVRENAFLGCINLSSVIGIKVESVYEKAFDDTQWLENQSEFGILGECLVIYKGLETEFQASDFPIEVKTIGSNAFRNSQLKSIVIPELIEQINPEAFANSLNLRDVYILGEPFLVKDVFRYLNLASIHVTKAFYPYHGLDQYRAYVEQIKSNITLYDGDNVVHSEIYYGEPYVLLTGSRYWFDDETKLFYAGSGIWNSLKKNITLIKADEKNARWILNGFELFSYNLLPGDNYKFTKEGIYINSELKYTLPTNSLYNEYNFYANNDLISEGSYDGSFKIIEIKEFPKNYEIKVYNSNPFEPFKSHTSIMNCTKSLSQIPIAHPSEYIFDGFYADSSYENKIISVLQILAMAEKVIYAKWIKA